ncbi:MAG: glycosyl hydrolase family 2, partial [Gemmatimonadetes bacterium]|nr:glycosyl hydrolase family 2 [Gemmatimonadota bacterium]
MTRPGESHVARLLGLLAAFLAGGVSLAPPARAQAPARTEVLAFADTADIRVELEVRDAAALAGAPVSAVITAAEDGEVLWSGEIGRLGVGADGTGQLTAHVRGLDPRLWSPASPHLYHLSVEAGGSGDRIRETVRFGFRSFQARDGRLLLNGRPLFLRGNSINPPERTLPDSLEENRGFAEDYIRYLKSVGVNIIRLTRHSDVWLDVADEMGMLVFQGEYGTPEGGTPTSPPDRPFEESIEWYKEDVFEPLVNHPSVVIYVLSNEQAAPEISYLSRGAEEVERFLTSVYRELSGWDPNRAYIGNAGYGFGRSGDICDIHRYWGWYYNSFLSFYTLRDPGICWRKGRVQPITLTENTGNYTGVDGRFNLVSASKQPDSQLNWTGHAPEREQAGRALAYQAFVAKQAIEISRRIRARNPTVAGLMPFTTLFHNWWGIGEFADMGPKPVAEQYAVSYQPVLLSWELWTPQVYAGSTVTPVAHVVNDAESGEDLRGIELLYTLTGADGTLRHQGRELLADVPYYGTTSLPVSIPLPTGLPTGSYTLAGRVVRGGETLSRNQVRIFVAEPGFAGAARGLERRVRLYDPRGETRRALRKLGVPFREATGFDRLDPAREVLVVGACAWDDACAGTGDGGDRLRAFVDAGGRVLVLEQNPERFATSWLPAAVRLQTEALDHPLVYPGGRPFRNAMAVNPERPDHPVFDGI